MATNRLFIYDADTETAICIAEGYPGRWGAITGCPKSSLKFFNKVEEYPGQNESTRLQLMTESELDDNVTIIWERNSPAVKVDPDSDLESLQRELDKVRALNRENVGRVQARDSMIAEKDSTIQMLELEISKLKTDMIQPECYTELYEQKVKLEKMLYKLVDILHRKDSDYFD